MGNIDVNIVCVCKSGFWKNRKAEVSYRPEHVLWLYDKILPNVTKDFRFLCMSDFDPSCFSGRPVEIVPLIHGWPGWWSKMELFRVFTSSVPTFYIDLDTVVVGNIDDMLIQSDFTVLLNLSHRKGVGSGLMAWVGDYSYLYKKFARNAEAYMAAYVTSFRWGDQGFLEEHLDSYSYWQTKYPGVVCSFKLDVVHKGLGGNRIVCFQGEPKPWRVMDQYSWIA